jgi:HNH endonuclease
MSSTHIPKALRRRVAKQACHRCGYCQTAEAIVGAPMEIDHLIPEAMGGLTEEENLWLACSVCNDCKADRTASLDSATGQVVRLFNPRRQVWSEHFQWTAAGDRIVGLTAIWPGNRIGAEFESSQSGRGPASLGQCWLASTQG